MSDDAFELAVLREDLAYHQARILVRYPALAPQEPAAGAGSALWTRGSAPPVPRTATTSPGRPPREAGRQGDEVEARVASTGSGPLWDNGCSR